MPPISRLDHVVIAVKNLDAAAATYRKLGFTLTPRGLHEGKGTGNHCIIFAATYIELLGIADASGTQGRLAQRVNERGEGGIAIAYGADDADKTCVALRAAGIEAEDPNDLSRPLELDGKREMVRFRNVMMPGLRPAGLMQFVCTHETPALTRARREWQLHANGAMGISQIMIEVEKPSDIVSEYEILVGAQRVQVTKHGFVAWLDKGFLAFQSSKSLAEYRSSIATLTSTPRIAALVIEVNELDAASAMLQMAKVPLRESHSSIVVAPSDAHGIAVEFTEA